MNRNRPRIKLWKQALACLAAAALGWPQAAPPVAAQAVEAGRPILPGALICPYDLPSHRNFGRQETWAWSQRICLGEIADMSKFRGGDGFGCDPEEADDWPKTRDLSSVFLQTILNHEPYRGALPRIGVRIQCARFNEALDLSHAALARPLWLNVSRFRQTVDLTDLRSSSLISLDGSVFDDVFLANGLHMVGNLYLSKGAKFKKEVQLLGAKVGGQMDASQSTFDGVFRADGVEVAGALFMGDEAHFKEEVRLLGAEVASDLELDGSTFGGLFGADGLTVEGNLFMRYGAHFKKDVRLLGVKIGGNLEANSSIFDGVFQAYDLEVVGTFFMSNKASFKDVNLVRAVIRGSLYLRDSDFKGHLNLTSASVEGELHLTSPRESTGVKPVDKIYPPPRWSERARLTLRNAHVGVLNDTENSWDLQPGHLDLVGFTYDRLGGLRATRDSTLSARTTEWLEKWLAKQDGFSTSYNPQPFEQLAKVLRESGYPGKADAILFAARDHQRDSPATPWLTQAKLWLLWGLIGYGYHNWIAVFWFAGLILLGACVYDYVLTFGSCDLDSDYFWYSFDMALPLIELDKRHEKVEFSRGPTVYFYGHKLAGFVLVSFLVAGLSGLTK